MEFLVGLFALLGVAVFIIAFILVYGILGSYVVTTLWGWFVVPIFGLKALTIAQTWGLSLIPAWFQSKRATNKPKKEEYFEVFLTPLLYAAILLLSGWILKQFI